jgi:hypothetical protein
MFFLCKKLNEKEYFELYRQSLLLIKMICIQNIDVINESIDLVVQSILKCFQDGLDETVIEFFFKSFVGVFARI